MARSDRQGVAIIGGGLMGAGLARLFTGAGWRVAISEPDAAARDRLRLAFPEALVTGVLAEAADGASLVIEAAPERVELKRQIFAELVHVTQAGVPLATNSSVIPVTQVTAGLDDAAAARVLGAHFWNPPDVIPLVEVIQAPRTGPEAVQATLSMLRQVGKEPVHIRVDTVPGNRLQHALWREAIAIVQDGICDAETLDTVVKASFGRRLAVLGPLENADLIGTDLTLAIHRVLLPHLDRTPGPLPLLERLVADGRLGAKSGAGFRDWTDADLAALRGRLFDHLKAGSEPSPADRLTPRR